MSLFLIKKNQRRVSGFMYKIAHMHFFYDKKDISYKVKFTDSCIYELNSIDYYGVNKLFGLTFGLTGVHKNSARFGWKPTTLGTIMIYVYCYVDGKRKEIGFTEVKINEYYSLTISIKDDKYIFKCKGISESKTEYMEIKHGPLSKMGYENFLYFGGTKITPKDIYIFMEKTNPII